MAFFERLRAPRIFDSSYGSEDAGDSDLLSQAASLSNLGRLVDLEKRRPMRPAMTFGQQVAASVPQGRSPSGGRGNMNVVYDQKPEQFAKQMELEQRGLDIKEKQADALSNLRLGELDVKQQNAATNRAKADAIMARQDLTDSEKMEMLFRNSLGLETARQSGRMELEGARGSNAMDRANVAADAAAGRARTAADARLAAIAAQNKGASERQEDAQAFAAGQPKQHAEAINNRAREVAAQDAALGQNIIFDEKGNFTINPDTDDMTRRIITERIYGPQSRDINLGKGADASALRPDAGGMPTTVQMIFPDGKTRAVPSNRVKDAESAGAKRR